MRDPRFKSHAWHLTEFFFLLVYHILLASDFYISFHSLSLFLSNWGKLNVSHTFYANFCSFLISHELESSNISTPQQLPARASMFTTSWVQLWLELLVCEVSFGEHHHEQIFGLKCLRETKIQILYDHADHTRFHIVEMGCQMVQLLPTYIVGPTMFVNFTPNIGPSEKPYELR